MCGPSLAVLLSREVEEVKGARSSIRLLPPAEGESVLHNLVQSGCHKTKANR